MAISIIRERYADFGPTFGCDKLRELPPRNDFNAHRPLRKDEDLNLIFTFREPRKVSHALTLQYDTVLYMLADNITTRKLIGRYIDVYEYPDGHIELHADGISLPYSRYDKLSEVNQGAIVENKRLGDVLQVTQVMQEQRDSRRGRSAPARTNQGAAPVRLKAIQGTKYSASWIQVTWRWLYS